MRAGVLRHTLVVRHPESLSAVALLAGEPVPDWAEGLVQADDYEVEAAKKSTASKSPAKK